MVITGNQPRKRTASVLLWGGMLLALAGLAGLAFVPHGFQATATVRVWKNGLALTNRASTLYDPDATLPGECELIRSQAILDPVIQSLDLNKHWGAGRNQEGALTTVETRQRLRDMIAAEPVPNSGIISITVTSQDAVESAGLANGIASNYCQYRAAQRAELSREAVGVLNSQLVELDRQIAAADSNLTRIAESINYDPATNTLKYLSPELFARAQSNRAALRTNIEQQTRLIEAAKMLDGGPLLEIAARLDNDTNSAYAESLRQLEAARQRLAALRTTQGESSPDVKGAEAALTEKTNIATHTARTLLSARDLQVAGMTAELNALNAQLKNVTTNLEAVENLHPDYLRAQRDLALLKSRRDDLQDKMKSEDSKKAVLPPTLSAAVVDGAVVSRGSTARRQELALSAAALGALLAAAGLFAKRVKPAPPSNRPGNPRGN